MPWITVPEPPQPPRDPYHYERNLKEWERTQEWQHQRQQDRIEQKLEQEGTIDGGEEDRPGADDD